ncbi:hypothetical protein Plhal304r1_c002g0008111 [Plasmopara halstedii]
MCLNLKTYRRQLYTPVKATVMAAVSSTGEPDYYTLSMAVNAHQPRDSNDIRTIIPGRKRVATADRYETVTVCNTRRQQWH